MENRGCCALRRHLKGSYEWQNHEQRETAQFFIALLELSFTRMSTSNMVLRQTKNPLPPRSIRWG